MTITDKKVVHIHYTLKNDAGDTLDSSEGRDPLAYIHGLKNIIVGLEKALTGKSKGDKVSAKIPPEEGYGVKRDDLVQKAKLEQFEDPSQVKVGAAFQMQTPDGVVLATVVEVGTEEITLDLNHPLADQTLHFEVDIVDIRDASKEELEHGHVHGPGGHQH